MNDVVERIRSFNAGRIQRLRDMKYGKMRADIFTFFRGTCHLFYEDLHEDSPLDDAPPVWVSGDLHLLNFSTYQGDDGLVYFDINDFDESLLAPATWDIARFLTSILVGLPMLKPTERNHLLLAFLNAYASALAAGQMRAIHTEVAPAPLRRVMEDRQQRNRGDLLNEYTRAHKKKRQIEGDDNTETIPDPDYRRAIAILKNASEQQPDLNDYNVCDIATRLSGVGSMGVQRYLYLLEGERAREKYRLLEIKQRLDSALEPYSPLPQPEWRNPADRVVGLQSRLQAVPPAPLTTAAHGSNHYTLRELYPADDKINLDDFPRVTQLTSLIEVMGAVTAYAHLRSCGRQGAASADTLIAFAAQPGWQQAALDYARAYSKKVAADFDTFCESDLGT